MFLSLVHLTGSLEITAPTSNNHMLPTEDPPVSIIVIPNSLEGVDLTDMQFNA